ncbi:alpha/beta fold hydrolase [Sphingomonas sp. HF-S3]|uniref:Alpha/beta fold hydrolase n=1 Tax=Sphingomonas rustica TaxID=3103142 RepID=A0ABV0B8C7_9SPHN
MGLHNWLRGAIGALGLIAAAPLAAQPAAAQASAPRASDPLAEALALPFANGLTGAKDRERFAWVVNQAGVRNLWVADAGKPAEPVTRYRSDDGHPLYHVAISDDGQRLAWVKGGDDEFPDGAPLNAAAEAVVPKQQLWLQAQPGADPVAIGEGHSPTFSPDGARIAFVRRGEIWLHDASGARRVSVIGGTASDLHWSPDGTNLLFVDNQGDHAFVTLLDPASGALKRFGPALGYSVEPTFSPDGRQVAFIQYLDPPGGPGAEGGAYWSLRIAEVASGATRTLWRAPTGMGRRYAGTRMRNLYWTRDDRLIFPWERSGWLHAYAIDAGKGGEPRELTPGAFEVETFILAPDGRSLVFAANRDEADRRHLWQLGADGKLVRLTGGTGSESLPVFAGGQLAAIATSASQPAHPVRLSGGRLTPLGQAPALRRFVEPQPVTYTAEDGVTVHAQLFRASGSGRHPAVIFVHGGPRRQMLLGFHPYVYYSNAYILNQHLAAQGYDVLSINYRSGTGYGRDFRDAPETGRDGASEYRDVVAGGRWLAAQAHVDPARIGIWGGSWGGYLTALALARDSALFAAGVDFHGVHSLLRSPSNSQSLEAQDKARRLQWDASPIASIDRWRSPVLLIHGDDDKNVDFAQSTLLARELAARGIPYEDLAFPGDRHDFIVWGNWLTSYRATVDFLNRNLKDKRP